MVACFVLEMYPTIRLTQSMWPLCGSALVLEIVIMAVAMYQQPKESAHSSEPIDDCYFFTSSMSNNSDTSY